MTLTEEQKERIERNRLKALELQAQRKAATTAAPESAPVASVASSEVASSALAEVGGFSEDAGWSHDRTQQLIIQEFDRENQAERDKAEQARKGLVTQCQYEENGVGCTRTGVDQVILEAFNEAICSVCKLKTDDFDFLTKSNAANEYLLPDDVFRVLPFHTKNNPFNSSWTPMKLYLRKHVRGVALKRYGSAESIEEERRRRETKKFERNVNQTNAILAESAEEFRSELAATATATVAAVPCCDSAMAAGDDIGRAAERYSSSSSAAGAAGKGKKRQNKNSPSDKSSKKRKALNDLLVSIRGDA